MAIAVPRCWVEKRLGPAGVFIGRMLPLSIAWRLCNPGLLKVWQSRS